MLEALLSVLVLATMSLLFLKKEVVCDVDYLYYSDGYLLAQCDALSEQSVQSYCYPGVRDVSFDPQGHPSYAGSFFLGDHQLTIHIGTGYLSEQ